MQDSVIDISFVITNFNREKFIDRAIRSCQSQVLLNKKGEIIVVDDGSTDNSINYIWEFRDKIRLFQNETNKGVANASNIGLASSRGKYWMRVDADDFLSMYASLFMAQILDSNEEFGFVYCDHYRVDTIGVKQEKVKLTDDKTLYEHGAGILFRKQLLDEIGGYDESLNNCEDYDLILRLQKRGIKGFYLPIPLYRYYIHGANITLDPERAEYWEMVEKKNGF